MTNRITPGKKRFDICSGRTTTYFKLLFFIWLYFLLLILINHNLFTAKLPEFDSSQET